ARLSLFRDGWTLEAAEQVCSDFGFWILDFGLQTNASPASDNKALAKETQSIIQKEQDPHPIQNPKSKIQNEEILDLLTALVDRSLVIVEEQDEALRWRMLESLRQFAAEKLADPEEAELLRRAHAAFFVRFAQSAEVHYDSPEEERWLNLLETEREN